MKYNAPMANLPYQPSWAKYEDAMHSSDSETQIKATDEFIKEREKETSSSRIAKEWEESRKKEIAKNKTVAVKERLKKERENSTLDVKKLKQLGNHERMLRPAPGYILVEVNRQPKQTASGIYFPAAEAEPNTGTVLAVGQPLISGEYKIYPPCEVGMNVLFKRMAGADIGAAGKDCRLMQFSDILAEFEDD